MPSSYMNRLERLETHAAGGRVAPLLVVECRADAEQETIAATIVEAKRARGDSEGSDGLVVVLRRFVGCA